MERNSTFELLRIVAILLIMTHHIIVFGLGGGNYNITVCYDGTTPIVNDILNCLCIVGVNLFILITGYFGVKSVARSLFRLIPVYLCVVIFVMIQRHEISSSAWNMKEWWYIPHFCILVLCSPMIESSIADISQIKFTRFIILLTIINVLFGYYRGYVNSNGYNFVNFVYLYYIARYMKSMRNNRYICIAFKYGIYIYLLCSITLGVIHTYSVNNGHAYDSMWYFGYNNPLVLISSIGLFCWFSTKHIQSKFINFIAGGTFAVYLICTKEFGQLHIGSKGLLIFIKYSYWGMILYSLLITVVLYLPCSVVCWLCKKIPFPVSLQNIL